MKAYQPAIRLIRPGAGADILPVDWEIVDATKIIATFDLTGAPYGLYDLSVTNADGETAIVAYRFLIEPMIEPDVMIGIGGPRTILASDTGTYSVALANMGNIDAPYTFFQIGLPEMGINEGVAELPYAQLTSNVRGGPDEGPLSGEAWAELEAMKESGLLRPDPEESAPPIREHPQVTSLMSVLATGILGGPSGDEFLQTQDLSEFFQQVRLWYGDDGTDIVTGTDIYASARVFLDKAIPDETETVVDTVDAVAPTANLDVMEIEETDRPTTLSPIRTGSRSRWRRSMSCKSRLPGRMIPTGVRKD